MAEMPFARDRVLATVLHACGERAARQVFPRQVQQSDDAWLGPFFDAFALYVRSRLCADADRRLTAAYAELGFTQNGKMSLGELLKHEIVQNVLRDCMRPFEQRPLLPQLLSELCDNLNAHVTREPNPDEAAKLGDQQVADFLALLSLQVAMLLPPAQHDAALASLADRRLKCASLF